MKLDWRLWLFTFIGLVYAIALLGAALVAWRFTDPQKSGLANAALPLVLSGALAACSVMALWIRKDRLIGMIGIHLGLVIPLIGAIALAWRAWERLQVDGIGSPQVILLGISGVLGAFVFAAMLRTRPPKEERAKPDAAPGTLN
jgi:hypothetical protein